MSDTLKTSIERLCAWVEAHDYRAYDPGDGNSSFFHALTFNNLLLERLLQQAVYRAPCNLRPWIGIRPHVSTKGMGYMAWGYVRMFADTGEVRYQERAVFCLRWLMEHRSPGFADHCWGNHFSFSSRAGKIPALAPTIVWSSLIGQAFVAAYETFEDSQYLEVAASICRWILTLPREQTDCGLCLSYVAFEQSSIHNSNMLGAALLARTGTLTKNEQALMLAREAMLYSCSRQLPNGAWWYAEQPKYQWVDNFHTGYNLVSLKHYIDATGDETWRKNLQDGLRFYKSNFFEDNGCPKYYHNRRYPIDIQCAGQSVETLAVFSEVDPSCLDLAVKAALWIIENMQDHDGHFYYRIYPLLKAKTAMLHWGQGTMYKGLAQLAGKLQRASAGPSLHVG